MTTCSGWHERRQPVITPQGIKNKAPVHREVAAKKGLETTLRMPMVSGRKRRGYWTEITILEELNKIKKQIGHFPSKKELAVLRLSGLGVVINRYGGINRFRELLGDEIIHTSGYWTDERIIDELKKIINDIGHFPASEELITLKRGNLSCQIVKHGGFPKFRILFGESPRKPFTRTMVDGGNVCPDTTQIDIICKELDLREEVSETAKKIATDFLLKIHYRPIYTHIFAASVYMASMMKGDRRTQVEIASVVKTTPPTIKKWSGEIAKDSNMIPYELGGLG